MRRAACWAPAPIRARAATIAQFSPSRLTPSNYTSPPARPSPGGVGPNDKVYDAATTATLSIGTPKVGVVFPGDSVTLNVGTPTGTFVSKNVGTNIPVVLAGFTLAGPDSSDYVLNLL